MQFSYTAEGIAAMKEWADGKKFWKNRHPGAIGHFELPSGSLVSEGDYVVKTDTGFHIMGAKEFEQLFSVEQETTTDNSYEP